jgi:hypothetical protein
MKKLERFKIHSVARMKIIGEEYVHKNCEYIELVIGLGWIHDYWLPSARQNPSSLNPHVLIATRRDQQNVCYYSGYCLRKSFPIYSSYQRGWVETKCRQAQAKSEAG